MNILYKPLARLASIEYQKKYIVNATKEKYVMAEDVFEDAASALNLVINQDRYHKYFSAQQLTDLQEFYSLMKQIGPKIPWDDENMTAEEFVLREVNWARVRNESLLCLNKLGVDVGSLDQYLN